MHPDTSSAAATPSRAAAPHSRRGRRGSGRGAVHPTSRKPWDLFLFAAAGLLLVSQARIQVFLPFSLPRPALIMGLVALALWLMQADRVRSLPAIMRDRIGQAAFLVAIAALVGVPFSLSLGSSARFVLENFSRTFLVFMILAAAVRNIEDVRRLIGTFAVGAAVFGMMAPVGRGGGASVGGYDPNDAAMFLVSALPCLIFFILHGRRLVTRIAAGLSAFTVIAAIVITQSRGGFIGLVAVATFMIFVFKGVKPAVRVGVVAAVIVASTAVSSPEYWARMQTITAMDDGYSGGSGVGGRRDIWARAVQYTAENPLTGVGINQFSRAEGQHPLIRARIEAGIGTKYSVAHSMWFQAMAELGVLGFMAFLGMFVLSLRRLHGLQKLELKPSPPIRPGEIQAMAGVLMGSLVGVMAAGSFLTHAYSSMVWGPVGIIVGFSKVSTLHSLAVPRRAGIRGRERRHPHSGMPRRRTTSSVRPHRG